MSSPTNRTACVMKSFPRTLYYPNLNLLTWHPVGVLGVRELLDMEEFLLAEERSALQPFNRYADLNELEELRLRFGDALDHSDRRRAGYPGPEVKTAIGCSRPMGFGLARMYATLMEGGAIRVQAYRERAQAAQWLGVPLEALFPSSECFTHPGITGA